MALAEDETVSFGPPRLLGSHSQESVVQGYEEFYEGEARSVVTASGYLYFIHHGEPDLGTLLL
jgi:hypothetical protein